MSVLNARALIRQGLGFGARAVVAQGFVETQAVRCPEPRAVAAQGFGFGPRSIAMQGLLCPRTIELPIPVGPRPARRRRSRDDEALLFMLLR